MGEKGKNGDQIDKRRAQHQEVRMMGTQKLMGRQEGPVGRRGGRDGGGAKEGRRVKG